MYSPPRSARCFQRPARQPSFYQPCHQSRPVPYHLTTSLPDTSLQTQKPSTIDLAVSTINLAPSDSHSHPLRPPNSIHLQDSRHDQRCPAAKLTSIPPRWANASFPLQHRISGGLAGCGNVLIGAIRHPFVSRNCLFWTRCLIPHLRQNGHQHHHKIEGTNRLHLVRNRLLSTAKHAKRTSRPAGSSG